MVQKHEVVIIDDLFSERRRILLPLPVRFERGSINDIDHLNSIFEDADGVFHQAAIKSVPRSVKKPATYQ